MSQQLFLGKVSLQQDAKQVNFITFQGTTTVGSDRVTAISTGTSKFRVGQTITTVGGAFASNPTILQIISSTEVEVDQNATTTRSGILGLNAGADNYYLSGSFTDPTNQETVLSITGSDDSDFEGNEWACIIPSMDENGTGLPGVFHVYNITSVVDRDNSTAAIDFFIKYGESGSEADFNQYVDTGQRVYGLVQRSTLEDLSPSLSKGISGLNDLPGGIEVAGLNILITDYLDNFT